jgi:hypothetical protein
LTADVKTEGSEPRILGPNRERGTVARETCIVRSFTIAFLISMSSVSRAVGK